MKTPFALLPLLLCTIATLSAGPLADADRQKILEHIPYSSGTEWTWVFYGDSITHGAKHTYGWRSFPEIFEERIRFEYVKLMDSIINSGISGNTVGALLNDHQYQWRVQRFKPDVVFILIGLNDFIPMDDYKAALTKLTQRVRADGAIPILQTYNTIQWPKDNNQRYILRNERFDDMCRVIREVASELDVILVDHATHWKTYASDKEVQNFWLGETIHPGAKGHQEMANEIFRALGLYYPVVCTQSLTAGGTPSPEVAKAMKEANLRQIRQNPAGQKLLEALEALDSYSGWAVDYKAADGLPSSDQWDSQFPQTNVRIQDMDGAPALRLDCVTTPDQGATITWKDTAKLAALHGIIRFDTEFAMMAPFDDFNFFMGFAAPGGEKSFDIQLNLGPKMIRGSFGFPENSDLKLDTFYRMTILLDSDSGSGLICLNGQIAFYQQLPQSKAAPSLVVGDNSLTYGHAAVRRLRLGGDQ